MPLFKVKPTGAPLGAEVLGLDLSQPLDAETVQALLSAWYAHVVLLFRDQTLTDETHFRFTEQLGPLEHPPERLLKNARGEVRAPAERPDVNIISNVIENGKAIGQLGYGEAYWHTDSSFVEVPPAASLLRSLEVPPPEAGGNTAFMNMYLALETMPAKLRAKIAGKKLKHDPTYTSAGKRRAEYPEVSDPSQSPGPIHPIERTHPDTRRKALFLGRRLSSYVVGLNHPDSEDLLNEVWGHLETVDLTWEHTWQAGDLVIWDNRAAMHRRDAFDPSFRRVMHRTQLAGTRPY